jgi:hypothetical protein
MPAHGARLRPALRLLLLVAVAGALIALAGTGAALMLAPAALLLVPLLLGHFPGERVIQRLARRATPVRRTLLLAPPPRSPRALGAHLAGLAVPGAGRGPPAAAFS